MIHQMKPAIITHRRHRLVVGEPHRKNWRFVAIAHKAAQLLDYVDTVLIVAYSTPNGIRYHAMDCEAFITTGYVISDIAGILMHNCTI